MTYKLESQPLLQTKKPHKKSSDLLKLSPILSFFSVLVFSSISTIILIFVNQNSSSADLSQNAVSFNRKSFQGVKSDVKSNKRAPNFQFDDPFGNTCIDNSVPVLQGIDVVSYFRINRGEKPKYGNTANKTVKSGFTFLFENSINKDIFDQNPEKYFPAWGGFGAYGIAFEQEKWVDPDSKISSTFDPYEWKIASDGKLYLFETKEKMDKFSKTEKMAIEKGNNFWSFKTKNCQTCFNTMCPTKKANPDSVLRIVKNRPLRLLGKPISKVLTSSKCINSHVPVLNGADVVAYFSLKSGSKPVKGSENIRSFYGGFQFLFSTSENKQIFERSPSSYLPAWGNFDSYSIAFEENDLTDPMNGLQYQFNPSIWCISSENRLHFFKNLSNLEKFQSNEIIGLKQGNDFWRYATDDCPTCFNTACAVEKAPEFSPPWSKSSAWNPPKKTEDENILSLRKESGYSQNIKSLSTCADKAYPVANGIDVVSMFGLDSGDEPIYGSESVPESYFKGYSFRFSTIENKKLFDENPSRYLPAWGGFGSFGLAHSKGKWTDESEEVANNYDPKSWKIGLDDRLYFFESALAMNNFMQDEKNNIVKGNFLWKRATKDCENCYFNTACIMKTN